MGGRKSSISVTGKQGSRIARAVDDMHDDKLRLVECVVDGVAFVEMNPKTGCKFVAAGANFRAMEQRREARRFAG